MKVTTILSQSQKTEREARLDDHPAVLEEPQDHAVTGVRDVSLHYEGGHSAEHHTVALESTDEPQKQRTSQTRLVDRERPTTKTQKKNRRNHTIFFLKKTKSPKISQVFGFTRKIIHDFQGLPLLL